MYILILCDQAIVEKFLFIYTMNRIDKGESQSVKILIKVLVLKFVKYVLNIKKIDIQA